MPRPRTVSAVAGVNFYPDYIKQRSNHTPTKLVYVLLKVIVGGIDITGVTLGVRLRFGYDLRIAECEIDASTVDAAITHWDRVEVWAGIHSLAGDTASDIAGASQGIKRFDGYMYNFNMDDYPETITLECRGPLILADRILSASDAWAEHTAMADPLAVPSQYDPPGIDLSVNPDTLAPWTDADMVTWILTECGLASRLGTIGGTSHILGSVGFDQFIWDRGESALSFCEKLDSVCLGQRVFETLAGNIVRASTSPRAPFEYTSFTVAEASDILEGASATRNADEVKNRAVVSGYDAGGGPEVAVVFSGASILPPGVPYATIELSSGMIENSFAADGFDGLACDEVGTWLLSERVDAMIDATIPTWRDDAFSPGQIIYLNAPYLDGVNQSMWLRRVDITVNPTSFTQVLQLHDRAQRDRGGTLDDFGISLGSSSLPLGLG